MRKYELTIILDPEIDPTDAKKRDVIVRKLIVDDAKFIKETITIGKKQLAYEMKKHTQGIYVLVKLEADRIDIEAINKQAKLMPEIIRLMLINIK